MRPVLGALCLLAALLFLLPVAALPPDPDGIVWGGVVSGKVLGPDGKPVDGASVCLVVNQFDPDELADFQIQTKPDGSFAFRPLSERQFPVMIFAVKAGYGTSAVPTKMLADRTGMTMQLRAGKPVEARITDGAGHPVADATVRMLEGSWSRHQVIGYYDSLTTRTDRAGRVRIPWLGSGDSTRIMITHPQYGTENKIISAPSQPLTIRLVRGARITGRVLHAGTGKAAHFADVSCHLLKEWEEGRNTHSGGCFTASDGKFVLENLQPGDYLVAVRDTMMPARWVAQRLIVHGLREGKTMRCPDLVFRNGAELTGKILDEKTGEAVRFATVGAQTTGERWNQYYEATTFGDGTFSLRVPAGKWTITPRKGNEFLPSGGPLVRQLKEGERVKDLVLKLSPVASTNGG